MNLKEARKAKYPVSFFAILALLSFGASAQDTPPEAFTIEHLSLDIKIIPEKHRLEGTAQLMIRSGIQGLDSLDFYLRPTLKVEEIKDSSENPFEFTQREVKRLFPNSDTSHIRLSLNPELDHGETAEIFITYAGEFFMSSEYNTKERRYERAFSSITEKAAWLRHVQLWYPYFEDKTMPLTIRATVPPAWTVITNGRLDHVLDSGRSKTFVFHDKKISSLDIILFAAPYVSKSRKSKNFSMTAYFFPEHRDLIDPYLEETGKIFSFFCQKFGKPKPDSFNIMEIGTGYGTGTGAPFGYGISSHLVNLHFPVIAHEIAHLWWGETVQDNLGEDTWLHEGLATFSEAIYRTAEARSPRERKQILYGWLDASIPVGNPETPSILDAGARHVPEGYIVYERAAFVIQTLKHLLGEKLFLRAIKQYVDSHREKKADTASFIRLFNSFSKRDLTGFFDFYLKGNKVPEYRVEFQNFSSHASGILHQFHVPDEFAMPVPLEFVTNSRSFQRTYQIQGRMRKFALNLNSGEKVLNITIDPDFNILAVREELEDRWEARVLRIEAQKSKDFESQKSRLFSLRNKHPDNAHILHEVGQFYYAQEKWEEGIRVYQKIVELDPDDFTFIALANIAGAYEFLGQTEKQIYYLEKALARGSNMYSIMRSLSDTLVKLKERQP